MSARRYADATHRALVHEGLHDVREQRGDVRLPDLALVARDLEPHPSLHICQLSAELALFGVLSKPPAREGQDRVLGRDSEGYALREAHGVGTAVACTHAVQERRGTNGRANSV